MNHSDTGVLGHPRRSVSRYRKGRRVWRTIGHFWPIVDEIRSRPATSGPCWIFASFPTRIRQRCPRLNIGRERISAPLAGTLSRLAAEPVWVGSVKCIADVGHVSTSLGECYDHFVTAIGIGSTPIALDVRWGCQGEITAHDLLDIDAQYVALSHKRYDRFDWLAIVLLANPLAPTARSTLCLATWRTRWPVAIGR